jgi:hypothetical protein
MLDRMIPPDRYVLTSQLEFDTIEKSIAADVLEFQVV